MGVGQGRHSTAALHVTQVKDCSLLRTVSSKKMEAIARSCMLALNHLYNAATVALGQLISAYSMAVRSRGGEVTQHPARHDITVPLPLSGINVVLP